MSRIVVDQLTSLMFDLDIDGNSELNVSGLRNGADHPQLQELLRDIDLPPGCSGEALFDMLDLDSSGTVARNEFIGCFARLVFSTVFFRENALHACAKQMRRDAC